MCNESMTFILILCNFFTANMNPMFVTAFVLCLASSAVAIFDGGVTILGTAFGASALSGGGLALTAGTSAAFLTTAGVAAAGLGLLGAAIVKGAIVGSALRNRGKRSTEELETTKLAALQLVDSYFATILDVDYDDCGKKFVCEIFALPENERTDEENLISGLFGDSNTIDPLSAKAEYDLAAFVGANYDKAVCARRYHRCESNRKIIGQALKKIENAPQEKN